MVVARDGKEVLKAVIGFGLSAKKGDRKPVMVLLDLDLPFLNGHIVLRLLRTSSYGRNVPIIALASTHDEAHRRESSTLGATEVISKPIGEATIKALLDKYVRPAPGASNADSPPDQ